MNVAGLLRLLGVGLILLELGRLVLLQHGHLLHLRLLVPLRTRWLLAPKDAGRVDRLLVGVVLVAACGRRRKAHLGMLLLQLHGRQLLLLLLIRGLLDLDAVRPLLLQVPPSADQVSRGRPQGGVVADDAAGLPLHPRRCSVVRRVRLVLPSHEVLPLSQRLLPVLLVCVLRLPQPLLVLALLLPICSRSAFPRLQGKKYGT